VAKSINHVTLLGNIGKDPELKYTPQGTPVARISLATNERFKKGDEWQERTEWHNVILWARLAEIAKEYLHKGSKIAIEGSLRTRSWDSDGKKHYMTEIIVSDLVMLDARKTPDTSQEEAKAAAVAAGPITDEDIPF
jgi:single-strand DNA-binding protein